MGSQDQTQEPSEHSCLDQKMPPNALLPLLQQMVAFLNQWRILPMDGFHRRELQWMGEGKPSILFFNSDCSLAGKQKPRSILFVKSA